eukprot:scaffold96233_cov33-Tisochrysis_lutea.AAC.1
MRWLNVSTASPTIFITIGSWSAPRSSLPSSLCSPRRPGRSGHQRCPPRAPKRWGRGSSRCSRAALSGTCRAAHHQHLSNSSTGHTAANPIPTHSGPQPQTDGASGPILP